MSQLQAAELGPFLTERLKHATQALVALPDDVFRFDPELAVEQLIDRFGYAELIVSDRAEVESHGTRRAYATDHHPLVGAECNDVSLRIPFTGPAELWAFWPSRRFTAPSYTDVELRDGYFRFVARSRDARRDEALGGVGLVIDKLQTTARWINIEVRIWLAELSFRLGRAASARRSILSS